MAGLIYNPKNVSVAWVGLGFQDFTPDSFLMLTPNADRTDEEVGIDNTSISINPDKSYTIKASFQQGGFTHKVLSAVMSAEDLSGKLTVGDMVVNDPSGNCLIALTGVHIKRSPEYDYGNTASGKSIDYTFFAQRAINLTVPSGVGESVDPVIASAALTAASYLI